jgi:hypothetical protein
MPTGEMFTIVYDIRNILTEIVARRIVERGERSLVVHANNARPHPANMTKAFCDDNFLRIASHPPHPNYLPDLAASDFFLPLVWPSQKPPPIQGQQFGSSYELLSGVRKILDEISVDILEAVFPE